MCALIQLWMFFFLEVEVLRSGVHDDDVENHHHTSPVFEHKQRKAAKAEANQASSQTPVRSTSRDQRSETSTPEADSPEAIMAALYSSTTSEAVPDHQEASDRLQDRSPTSGNGAGVRTRLPSGRTMGGNTGPFHSTPTETATPAPER